MKPNNTTILKLHLKQNGIKTRWLAERTGLSESYLSDCLANNKPLGRGALARIQIITGLEFNHEEK